MARLRIRIELNRGGVGVPLHKLASVVAEAQKFFHMVGDDIQIDQGSGEWLGFDFDHESLNFTAEFVGPVTPEQVIAFNAAFDGTTSLRRATIAQFAHITDAIGEDELIGFGLYPGDSEAEPGEWRCLSRRDALRISEEIRLLIEASEEVAPQSHLPAVSGSARIFSERRERAVEPAKWAGVVREVEANLSRRIGKLESEVEDHAARIEDLGAKSVASEASIGRLVSAVEGFCEQATKRLETLPPQSLPAGSTAPAAVSMAPPPARWRPTPVVSLALGVAAIGLLTLALWPSRPEDAQKTVAAAPVEQAPVKPAVVVPPPAPPPVAAEVAPPAPNQLKATVAHIEFEATEPNWVSVTDENGTKLMAGLLQPHDVRSMDLEKTTLLRTGNAAGLTLSLNGVAIGPLGPHGGVREVEFKNGAYRIYTPAK